MEAIIFKQISDFEMAFREIAGMFFIKDTCIGWVRDGKTNYIDFLIKPVDPFGDMKGVAQDLLDTMNRFLFQHMVLNYECPADLIQAIDQLLLNAGYIGKIVSARKNMYADDLIISYDDDYFIYPEPKPINLLK